MHFKPHGATRVHAEGRILCFEPQAAANAEEVQRIVASLEAPLAALNGAPWGALVVLARDDALMTPDAEAQLAAWAPLLQDRGLIALALCGRPADELWIAEAQFRRAFGSTSTALHVAGSVDLAKAWLHERLGSA